MSDHAEDTQFVALRVSEEELNALLQFFGKEKRSMKPESLSPVARVALRIVAASVTEPGTCMICGCTDARLLLRAVHPLRNHRFEFRDGAALVTLCVCVNH